MALRAFRGIRGVRRIPIGGSVAISQDGNVIAGSAGLHFFAVYRLTGELIARWPKAFIACATGEDGSWVAFRSLDGIEKWDVASQRRTAFSPERFEESRLRYWAGHLVGPRGMWRADDLSYVALPQSGIPHPGHAYPAGKRFLLSWHDLELVLWDGVRERSVLSYRAGDRATDDHVSCGVTRDGRFALTAHPFHDRLRVFDLAANRLANEVDLYLRRPDAYIVLSPCDRYLVATFGVVCASDVYELLWDVDPQGDTDPLTAAWGGLERPPIVDQFLPRMTHSDRFLRSVARKHPELEVAYARNMEPPDAIRWLQRALRDPAIAARPEAWLQLAQAALECADLETAGDACAQGLGRDENHEGLHALLGRVNASRKP
jgi:hypothetical protein